MAALLIGAFLSMSATASATNISHVGFKTLDTRDLAGILKKSHLTVRNDLSRNPERLPPAIRIAGRKAIWLEHKVLEWLEDQIQQPAKKRGRPTKIEQQRKVAQGGAV